MGIILDLSIFREETADIRLADGAVLHLKKPTERLVIHMLQMKDVDEKSPPAEILGTLNRIAQEILNNNADGVTFDMAVVSAMGTDEKANIVTAYSDWATRLQANPTSARPQGRAGTKPQGIRSWLSRRTPWRNMRA